METDTYRCAELSGSLLEVISMKARNERQILKNNSRVAPDCHLLEWTAPQHLTVFLSEEEQM